MAFPIFPRTPTLRIVRAIPRLHGLAPPLMQIQAAGRTMQTAGQTRKVSDIRRQRERVIAAMEASRFGSGSSLREKDEKTARAVRPPPGHKYWGLTIFRCTYKDDEAWSQLLKLIRMHVQESAEYYGAPDLLESFNLKVFEDPILEGASKTLVRQRFQEWRSSPAVEQERDETVDGHPFLIEDGRGGHQGTRERYHFCVHIDEESLYSNIDRKTKVPIEHAAAGGGYVNLVHAEWELPDPEEWRAINEMDAEVEDPLDEEEEPLEGCKMYDVGWMKTHITIFGVSAQSYLNDSGWDINYVRPPGIVERI